MTLRSGSVDPEIARRVRGKSLDGLRKLGFPSPPAHFPWLECTELRSQQEVVERALVLNVIINCAYRMPTDFARQWLREQRVIDKMTSAESAWLAAIDRGEDPAAQGHKLQVEALWVLRIGKIKQVAEVSMRRHRTRCRDVTIFQTDVSSSPAKSRRSSVLRTTDGDGRGPRVRPGTWRATLMAPSAEVPVRNVQDEGLPVLSVNYFSPSATVISPHPVTPDLASLLGFRAEGRGAFVAW